MFPHSPRRTALRSSKNPSTRRPMKSLSAVMRCASDTLTSLQPTNATRRTISGLYRSRRISSWRESFTTINSAGVTTIQVSTTRREKPWEFLVTKPIASRIATMIDQRTTTPIASGSVCGTSCIDSPGRPRGNRRERMATRIESTTKKLAKWTFQNKHRLYRSPIATSGGPTVSRRVMRAIENPRVNVIGSVIFACNHEPPGLFGLSTQASIGPVLQRVRCIGGRLAERSLKVELT